jgi:hypothetical protein
MADSERVPVDRLRGGDVILIPRYGGSEPAQPTYYAYTILAIAPDHDGGKREVRLALSDDPTSGIPNRTMTLRPDTTVLRRLTQSGDDPASDTASV